MPVAAIVADDFGMSTFRTDGIMQSFYNGSISQASLMVTGDDATRAVRLAKNVEHPYHLPLGLHFNITQGKCASQIPLVGLQIIRSASSSRDDVRDEEEKKSKTYSKRYQKLANTFIDPKQRKFRDKAETFCNVGNVWTGNYCSKTMSNKHKEELIEESRKFFSDIEENESDNPSGGGVGVDDDNDETSSNKVTDYDEEIWFNLVLEELCAQLALFEQLCGHFPFALDGHHHIHVLPIVAFVLSNFFKSPIFTVERKDTENDDEQDKAFSSSSSSFSFTSLQRKIIDHYLPGTSAPTAVRALRYLRVPLPPLCDISRIEDWRANRASLPKTGRDHHHHHHYGAHHYNNMMSSHNNNNNNSSSSWQLWTLDSVQGAPFFSRITWCAYHAFRLWENDGLFGPVEKRTTSKNNNNSDTSNDISNSRTVAATSPTSRMSAASFRDDIFSSTTNNTNNLNNNNNSNNRAQSTSSSSSVVENMSPFRRRGVVVETNSDNTNETAVVTAKKLPPLGSLCHAIIPRRLCCFASGPTVNVENIQTALNNLQKEEEELKIRRDMMNIISELEQIQKNQNQNNNSTTAAYFNQQMSTLKQKHFKLSRLTSNVENYQLFQNEKFVGNEWTDADRESGVYSLNVMPWATSCSEELEIMVHPSVAIPKLFNEQEKEEFVSKLTSTDEKAAEEKLIRQDQARHIKSSWYGPTQEFYCSWSRSLDRLVELKFLTTEEFSVCLSGANCAVACYDEYSTVNLIRGGAGRSTGRS